jgi:CRISPR-associated protein Csx10
MRIRLDLKSDLCSYGGDGFAGVVDLDIVYDIDGLPFIPSKRLKGLLRESAVEILDYDASFADISAGLFGEPGQAQGGSLKLGNGRLLDQAPGKDHTSLRTRTAMENGQAKNGSLRIMRVVKKGEAFIFDVDCGESHKKFLEMCCKGTRHLGLNRTRG